MCWEAADYLRAERLRLCLPDLAQIRERHDQLHGTSETRRQLATVNFATVERTLHDLRRGLGAGRMAQTKPGDLLRRQIPIVVGHWKALDVPGYPEIDLVSPSGEVAAGDGIWPLCATDLSTGWTERLPVMGKGERGIVTALEQVRTHLPVPLLGLDPNDGSEFLNGHPVRNWQRTGVALSRSRPGHKSDNAHVEQKNWTRVWRLIGYQRLDTPAQLAWLAALSSGLLRPFTNCFPPVMKLVRKETAGSRGRTVDDRPTPLARVLASGVADPATIPALVPRDTTVSPLTLTRRIDRRLAAIPATLEVTQSA